MKLKGREKIYTDVPEITMSNVIDIVRYAYENKHLKNARVIKFLLDYDAGIQPIIREKVIRPDINIECVDNIANQISKYHISSHWGNGISVTQRGDKVSKKNEPEAIKLLNEYYDCENIKAKTQELGRYVEIAGVGYTYVDVNTNVVDDDSYFKVNVLNPLFTFIIFSSYYVDNRPMLAVTFRTDEDGILYFTCFSDKQRFCFSSKEWKHTEGSGYINLIGIIPVVEWVRDYDRMGCFERQVSEMDNLNLLLSDYSNSVEQQVQAIWHCNDVDFEEEEIIDPDGKKITVVKKPKSNDWLQTYTTQEGRAPFVKPLAVTTDYVGQLNNINACRARILEECYVPQRNDNSGGSTGTATSMATGLEAFERVSEVQHSIMEVCKMQELKVVLRAINTSTSIEQSNPLLKLKLIDIKPSIKQRKTSELTTKVNAFATLVSHGVTGLHSLEATDIFEDIQQVWEDSKPLIEQYQDSIFNKTEKIDVEDRISQDKSDQRENSPFEDGVKTNQNS